jgi:hypothetical protein
MKTEKEVRDEIRNIRERVKTLSGFWIGEASAAIYALEWALDKRDPRLSADLGGRGSAREKIAASLVKLAEQAPPPKLPKPAAAGGRPKRADPKKAAPKKKE